MTNFGAIPNNARIPAAGMAQFPACRAFNSGSISLANGATVTLNFDSTRWDTSPTMHSNSTNTSRIASNLSGYYFIGSSLQFASNGTGSRQALLQVNGTTVIASNSASGDSAFTTRLSVVTYYLLNASDYVEILAVQNSGGSLNVLSAGNFTPELWVAYHMPAS